jgi:HK97 family phage prohead protease
MSNNPWFEKQVTDWQIKNEEAGTFTAYAATRRVDRDGDQFAPGAFAQTIKDNKGKIPLLVGHDSSHWAGFTTSMAEDEKGLWIEGMMILEKNLGRDTWLTMKACSANDFPLGFSVGFTAKAIDMDAAPNVRVISEVKLWEISTTPWPAQYGTGIATMKSFPIRQVEQILREAGGCSRDIAKKTLTLLAPYLSVVTDGEPLAGLRDAGSAEPLIESGLREIMRVNLARR